MRLFRRQRILIFCHHIQRDGEQSHPLPPLLLSTARSILQYIHMYVFMYPYIYIYTYVSVHGVMASFFMWDPVSVATAECVYGWHFLLMFEDFISSLAPLLVVWQTGMTIRCSVCLSFYLSVCDVSVIFIRVILFDLLKCVIKGGRRVGCASLKYSNMNYLFKDKRRFIFNYALTNDVSNVRCSVRSSIGKKFHIVHLQFIGISRFL